MTRAFLIRVGMDSVYGGFVSPIFPDNQFVFLPMPNVRDWDYQLDQLDRGLKSYSELKTNTDIPLTDYLPKDKIMVKNQTYLQPAQLKVHNDPEFISNTYGEKIQKKVIYSKVKDFKAGDYIFFYATFYPCDYNKKYCNYSFQQLRKMQKGKKQFYLISYLKLKYPPIYQNTYNKYIDEIQNNAHYIRGDFKIHNNSFILKGTRDSGWIQPIRIDDGIRKNGNYYMKPNFAQYKLKNQEKRGLNRCYCELSSEIINLLRRI